MGVRGLGGPAKANYYNVGWSPTAVESGTMGRRLRALRDAVDCSREYVADMCEISPTVLRRIEEGTQGSITTQYLVNLAEFYDVSTDYIVGAADDMHNT